MYFSWRFLSKTWVYEWYMKIICDKEWTIFRNMMLKKRLSEDIMHLNIDFYWYDGPLVDYYLFPNFSVGLKFIFLSCVIKIWVTCR